MMISKNKRKRLTVSKQKPLPHRTTVKKTAVHKSLYTVYQHFSTVVTKILKGTRYCLINIFVLQKFILLKHLTFGLQYIIMVLGYISEVIILPEKKKMGRPTDNPKGTPIHVRLDQEADTILKAYCEKKQIPKMEAVRRGIKKLKDDL